MIAGRLRDARQKRGLTQKELAQLCDLGINQINKYENEAHEPTVSILKKIAQELEVSVDYLIGLTDQMHEDDETISVKPDERELLDVYRQSGWLGVARLSVSRIPDNP